MPEPITHEPLNITVLLQVLQFATSAIVIPGTIALVKTLWQIKEHLGRLNGSVGELKQWKLDHLEADALDAENHKLTREQCQALHAERLSSVYKQIDVLYQRIGDRRQGERSTD
jgi:hypothetical protein